MMLPLILGGVMVNMLMMEKPVIEVDTSSMWDYEYQAKLNGIILASNSLINLKKEIRLRRCSLAWITTKTGCFSYGQNLVDEYPYKPRY